MKTNNNGNVLVITLKPEDGLQELAQQALQIQDACNLCALAIQFAEVAQQLASHPQNKIGTTWVNKHPIMLLWIDKFAQLSGYRQHNCSVPYKNCTELANGNQTEWTLKIE